MRILNHWWWLRLRLAGTALFAVMFTLLYLSGPAAAQAPFCEEGQAPQFVAGFLALAEQLGDQMGSPVECEHPEAATGDTLQQTSTGLAFYRQSTNTPTFTNGSDHWALTPDGLVSWTGESIDPPGAAIAPIPEPGPAEEPIAAPEPAPAPIAAPGVRSPGEIRTLPASMTDQRACYEMGQGDRTQDSAAGVPLNSEIPRTAGLVRRREGKTVAAVGLEAVSSANCGIAYLDGYEGAPFQQR